MSPIFRWCAVPVVALLLAACAGTGPVAPPAAPASAFELQGRVAARYQERVFSSALRWKQSSGSDEIWLTAPLGQTIAYLRADADGASLTSADQKQYRAGSIESLVRSALGWRFPVTGMRYWVLGQTAPNMTLSEVERDSAGRLIRFRQDDLKITFNYAEPEPTRLSRVEITGDAIELRLVIDSLTTAQP
jgi:outer membrane lipoprotein LolB